jgi:hypothetical protein
MIEELKPCPYCGSNDLNDCYVYIRCNKCLMEGPKMNGGHNDAHSDFRDRELAIEAWNKLPRNNMREKKLERICK